LTYREVALLGAIFDVEKTLRGSVIHPAPDTDQHPLAQSWGTGPRKESDTESRARRPRAPSAQPRPHGPRPLGPPDRTHRLASASTTGRPDHTRHHAEGPRPHGSCQVGDARRTRRPRPASRSASGQSGAATGSASAGPSAAIRNRRAPAKPASAGSAQRDGLRDSEPIQLRLERPPTAGQTQREPSGFGHPRRQGPHRKRNSILSRWTRKAPSPSVLATQRRGRPTGWERHRQVLGFSSPTAASRSGERDEHPALAPESSAAADAAHLGGPPCRGVPPPARLGKLARHPARPYALGRRRRPRSCGRQDKLQHGRTAAPNRASRLRPDATTGTPAPFPASAGGAPETRSHGDTVCRSPWPHGQDAFRDDLRVRASAVPVFGQGRIVWTATRA
jgi:hypothetical protein